jgi:hypothetical protein
MRALLEHVGRAAKARLAARRLKASSAPTRSARPVPRGPRSKPCRHCGLREGQAAVSSCCPGSRSGPRTRSGSGGPVLGVPSPEVAHATEGAGTAGQNFDLVTKEGRLTVAVLAAAPNTRPSCVPNVKPKASPLLGGGKSPADAAGQKAPRSTSGCGPVEQQALRDLLPLEMSITHAARTPAQGKNALPRTADHFVLLGLGFCVGRTASWAVATRLNPDR